MYIKLVEEVFKNTSKFFFIQIGANDGKTNDPLYQFINQYKPSGLLIEPIESVFSHLLKTYENANNLIFDNVGIYDKSENVVFYKIKESHQDIFKKHYKKNSNPSGISSLYREHLIYFIKKNKLDKFDNVDNFIESVEIKCLTFNDLILKHNVNKINLLQIDAEGYDFEIIRQVLEKTEIKPNIINFEVKNIKTNINIENYLKNNGYCDFIYHGNDLCVYNKK